MLASRIIRLFTTSAIGLAVVVGQTAFACPTCYTDALGPKGLQAIKSGILILLLPTIAIFATLMLLTFRYRNSCPSWRRTRGDGQELPDSDNEVVTLRAFEPGSPGD
ncbi:MAG: hypothetical protein HYX72_14610 [Acidobacteria bacterium]|nr:hypothetical protein [Acidobacteriota bacterium]